MAEKNYARQRASILENLDGLRVDIDAEKRIGYLILDREPLNIVSYTGRAQIRALIEEMDEDDDIGVIVIKGANGCYTSGGDVKAFPDIPKNKMSDLHWNIGAGAGRETGDRRDGEIRLRCRIRTRDGLRFPLCDEGYAGRSARKFPWPDAGFRRQRACCADCRPDPRQGYGDARYPYSCAEGP